MENGKAKPFDQVVMDIPIGSGPYMIGPVRFGKDITYMRDPDYWARDLPVGAARTISTASPSRSTRTTRRVWRRFKAGEFDLMSFYSAGDWARRVTGKRFDTGELVKREFAHRRPPASRASC